MLGELELTIGVPDNGAIMSKCGTDPDGLTGVPVNCQNNAIDRVSVMSKSFKFCLLHSGEIPGNSRE